MAKKKDDIIRAEKVIVTILAKDHYYSEITLSDLMNLLLKELNLGLEHHSAQVGFYELKKKGGIK